MEGNCEHMNVRGLPCKFKGKVTYEGRCYCAKHLQVVKSMEECVVCLCEMTESKDRIKLSCGHYFHRSCLSHVEKAECPLCRTVFTADECVRVFEKTVIRPMLMEIFSKTLVVQTTLMDTIKSLIKISRNSLDPNYYVSCVLYMAKTVESSMQHTCPRDMNNILTIVSSAIAYVKNMGSLDNFEVSVRGGQVYVNN
ncbi:hypothetical protein EBZ38_05035 [bacterium]|nr:hypothetical protein [bacterium]NDD83634.1 hypothetical protein [bacterium]